MRKGKYWQNDQTRGSRPEVFYKKGFHKKFSKLTEKNLWWSPFFDKAAGTILELYLKRVSGTGAFQ